MNNQLSGLDPKLQEKFHQVMNTPLPSTSTPTPGSNPTPIQPLAQAPTQPIQPAPTIPAEPAVAAPTMPTAPDSKPEPELKPAENHAPQPVLTPEPEPEQKKEVVVPTVQVAPPINTANSQVFSNKKKAGSIPPVFIILGTVVFFVVYSLVWVKVFNLKLPFLP